MARRKKCKNLWLLSSEVPLFLITVSNWSGPTLELASSQQEMRSQRPPDLHYCFFSVPYRPVLYN